MRNGKRLIDANALMKYIEDTHPYAGLQMAALVCTMELLTYAPTVEAVEVVHGRWEAKDSGFDWELQCSLCGEQYWIEKDELETHKPKYCPNCGARMDAEVAP